MTATIVIVTKNRLSDLRVALTSAMTQRGSVEIIVVDDGSSDGTAAMVRDEFPGATLMHHEQSRGYIVRRNEAATAARGDVVFSIDDDAEFSSPDVVATTLSAFSDPRVGAVAIPFIEPNKSPAVFQQAPDATNIWVTDCFIGTAHALRRDRFLALSGYRTALVHQGEERDYCLRLLASGQVVRLGHGPHILHYESPRRDWSRMDYYGRRNDVLFAWHFVPMPQLVIHLAGTLINAVRSAIRAGRVRQMARGTVDGLRHILAHPGERRAVPAAVYRLHRLLKKQSPLPLTDIIDRLPTLA